MSPLPVDNPGPRAPLLTILFVSLMLVLLVGPLFGHRVLGVPVLSVLFSLIAAAGVAASSRGRFSVGISILLVLPMLVALWIEPVMPMRSVGAASLGLRFVFLMFLCVVILNRVVRDQVVTVETIAGAASVYLLFGVAWSSLFGLVELLHPGSLFIPEVWGAKAATEIESLGPLIYFSFASLTTVGYGDIHATSPLAANLAVFEAIMGQLYLTVLVARLVGLQISHSEFRRHPT
jgi:hypothetical protein